jgi:lipopolysaccharide/colanic/teichoic acid biosynthesis glycosyltransferase
VLAPFAIPVGLLIGIAVFLDSPGPVLYRANRIGGGGRPFEMYKFRTMRTGLAGNSLAGTADARITPAGHFLRKSRLDELPQLWNVLRGQMSIVGPRPELEEFVALHAEDYREILSVPPGITGPTQLRYAGVEASLLSMHADPETFYRDELLPDKVSIDVAYARSHSLWRDFVVVCQTLALPLILLRQGSRAESEPAGPLRSVAHAGLLMAAAVLPVVFALGLGSPR